MRNKAKLIFSGFILLLSIGFSKQIGKAIGVGITKALSSNEADKNNLSKQQFIEILVKEMKSKTTLPLRIDEITTLNNIYSVGEDVLIYEYLLDGSYSIDVIKMKQILFDRIKGNVGKVAKENKISLGYIYKSKSTGKIVASIRFENTEF